MSGSPYNAAEQDYMFPRLAALRNQRFVRWTPDYNASRPVSDSPFFEWGVKTGRPSEYSVTRKGHASGSGNRGLTRRGTLRFMLNRTAQRHELAAFVLADKLNLVAGEVGIATNDHRLGGFRFDLRQ